LAFDFVDADDGGGDVGKFLLFSLLFCLLLMILLLLVLCLCFCYYFGGSVAFV